MNSLSTRSAVIAALLATTALAQPPADDLADAAPLLEAVRDNVFSFDDPAFYWFCRYVDSGKADAALATVTAPLPWKMLLERPSDYRGKPVVIAGTLQTCHAIDVTNRAGVGRLYQCELSDPNTRAICTVICTADASGVPPGSQVGATGFFIKVRAYQTNAGEGGAGPLLVAKNLAVMTPPATGIPDGGPRSALERWMIPAIAVLAVIWLLLRRLARKPATVSTIRPPRSADGTEDDFAWLSHNDSQQNPP